MDMVDYTNELLKNIGYSGQSKGDQLKEFIAKMKRRALERVARYQGYLKALEKCHYEKTPIPKNMIPNREYWLGKLDNQTEILKEFENV